MINRALIIDGSGYDPFHNLALEELLMRQLGENEVAMYLWQNDNTVVIGRHQNVFAQCNMHAVAEHKARIARRRSGGGAVYHDMGNLNYSFITPDAPEYVERDRCVVLDALRESGISAALNGRNDIEAEGRKISGTAWYSDNGMICHHGTLLIDSDISTMSSVLTVDRRKWADKGIDSMRSRVVTLGEINSGINIADMRRVLCGSFREEYPGAVLVTAEEMIGRQPKLYGNLASKYSSHEWIYGSEIQADFSTGGRFPWGTVDIKCRISGDIIADIRIYSDSLETEAIQKITDLLGEARFCSDEIAECVSNISCTPGQEAVINDIAGLLMSECPQGKQEV